MITKGFIAEVRERLNELDIKADTPITHDDLFNLTVGLLNQVVTMNSVRSVLEAYHWCDKKWNKIEKIFAKHFDKWKELDLEITTIEKGNKKEQGGVWHINNIMLPKRGIMLSSTDFENKYIPFVKTKGKYTFDGMDTSIKGAVFSSSVMKVFDKNNKHICNIQLTGDNELSEITNNDTNIEIVCLDVKEEDSQYICAFWKDYADKAKQKDDYDLNKAVAYITWDMLDGKTDLAFATIIFCQEVEGTELEVIALAAAASFQIFTRKMNTAIGMAAMAMMH